MHTATAGSRAADRSVGPGGGEARAGAVAPTAGTPAAAPTASRHAANGSTTSDGADRRWQRCVRSDSLVSTAHERRERASGLPAASTEQRWRQLRQWSVLLRLTARRALHWLASICDRGDRWSDCGVLYILAQTAQPKSGTLLYRAICRSWILTHACECSGHALARMRAGQTWQPVMHGHLPWWPSAGLCRA